MNLGQLLEQSARRYEGHPFVTMAENGETLTYGEFNRQVNRLAHGLQDFGIGPGDYVAIMLPNCLEFLIGSYALKKLGAIEVAMNRHFRGPALRRMLHLTPAKILVTSADALDVLDEVPDDLAHYEAILLVGDTAWPDLFDHKTRPYAEALSDWEDDFEPETPDTEPCAIMFTSGTTGVSKGSVIPHRAAVRVAEAMILAFDLTDRDCVYTPYPLFHAGAAYYDILPALMVGGRVVLRESFSASMFWPEVARYDATWFMMLGSVQQLLWAAPPSTEETGHKVRFGWGAPLPVDQQRFQGRFGLQVPLGGYGSTEAGLVAIPLFDHEGGRVLDSHEVAIVDEADDPIPAGEVGELVIRPKEPAVMFSGYFGMPEDTAAAWRNDWFHTGDLARLDADGLLYFVSRMSERIRVRGEMVSGSEVEEVVLTHPAVEDCAVIGVPSDLGDDDVKAFVSLRPGAALSAEELRAFCRGRMSRFMVPTHVAFLGEMPRTPTGKPAKDILTRM